MNAFELKNELDELYAQLNPPYGVTPQWHELGATEDEIKSVESRLGVALPTEVKEIYKVFSGITHETPYYMGKDFLEIKNTLLTALDVNEEEFGDDLVISFIEPLEKWGIVDELYDPKKEYNDLIEYMNEPESEGKAIFIGCSKDILCNEQFIYIGASYAESIFINLDMNSKDFGAIYNVTPFYPDLIVYKIANGYFDFINHLKASLKVQLNHRQMG